MQGKGNNLRCTMFQAQGLIYWTYRGASKTGETTVNLLNIFMEVII